MKIIKPSVEIMRTGLEKEYIIPEQFIERVGRTCYKSEDKIADGSAEKFVANLVKRGHEAMIEHYNLIFKTTNLADFIDVRSDWNMLMHNVNLYDDNHKLIDSRLRPNIRFTSYITEDMERRYIISGNMRAWRDFIKACITRFGNIPIYMYGIVRCYPTFFSEFESYIPPIINNSILIPINESDLLPGMEQNVHMNVTVKFVCDRGVSHELVRHRAASFAQESTRYCNYSKDKFGGEITVIRPSWCSKNDSIYDIWKEKMDHAESAYFDMLLNGATPQEARSVLPNSLKTEVIMTMDLDGWNHFFELRCAEGAHPDMREVAIMTRDVFKAAGLLKEVTE